jgi:hypothetical protein
MKGTEKQIAYAEALRSQFIAPLQQDIEAQERLIESYRVKMQADPSKDYSAKIEMRQERISNDKRKIAAVLAIDDAGELIDAIKFGRTSLYL